MLSFEMVKKDLNAIEVFVRGEVEPEVLRDGSMILPARRNGRFLEVIEDKDAKYVMIVTPHEGGLISNQKHLVGEVPGVVMDKCVGGVHERIGILHKFYRYVVVQKQYLRKLIKK